MNRRANINEKTVDFSPNAITVPKADQSGEIVNQGVQNISKGIMQIEDKMDTLKATAKFGDFNAAYIKGQADLQTQYKDNPTGYGAAVKALGEKLSVEYGKGMGTGAVNKFHTMTVSHIAQTSGDSAMWEVKQDRDNFIGLSHMTHFNVELAAEAALTPQALKDVLYKGPSSLEEVNKVSAGGLSATENLALKAKTRGDAVKNSMSARILDDPGRLHGDLRRGAYAGILETPEIKTYMAAAEKAMMDGADFQSYKTIKAMSATLSTTYDSVLDSTTSIGEISRLYNGYEVHKNDRDIKGDLVVPPAFLTALDRIRQEAMQHIPKDGTRKTQESETFLSNFKHDWETFMGSKEDLHGRDMATKELVLYSKLFTAHSDGIIDDAAFATQKAILDKRAATKTGQRTAGMTPQQAFEKIASKPFWGLATHEDELYSYGYARIRDRVNSQTDLTPQEKTDRINQYFLTYIDAIDKNPPSEVNKIKNYTATATKILYGAGDKPGLLKEMEIYRHPNRPEETLMYGQVTDIGGIEVRFKGLNDKGQPLWSYPKRVIDGLENQ